MQQYQTSTITFNLDEIIKNYKFKNYIMLLEIPKPIYTPIVSAMTLNYIPKPELLEIHKPAPIVSAITLNYIPTFSTPKAHYVSCLYLSTNNITTSPYTLDSGEKDSLRTCIIPRCIKRTMTFKNELLQKRKTYN